MNFPPIVKIGFILLLLIGLVLAFGGLAHSHSWYDAACCDDRDCAPIDAGEVERTDKGYVWTNGNGSRLFPFNHSDLRISQDEDYHGCEVTDEFEGSWKRCLYIPAQPF